MNFWNDFSFFTNNVIRLSGFCTEIDYNFPIYRARKKDFENLTDPRELKYIPIENCKKTGRANVPYHPVFYGSFDPTSAVAELKLKNEEVILSEWRWKENSKLIIKLFAKIEHSEYLKKYNIQTVVDYIEAIIKIKGPIENSFLLNEMIETSSHLSDLFLLEDDYFASAIVGFEELYRSRLSILNNVDAIIYPSIVSKNNINIAIHPEIVDEFLELKSVSSLYPSQLNSKRLIWESPTGT